MAFNCLFNYIFIADETMINIEIYTYRVYNILMEVYAMKKRVNISLDEEIAEQLKVVAETSKRNVSQWITDKVMETYAQLDKEEIMKGDRK